MFIFVFHNDTEEKNKKIEYLEDESEEINIDAFERTSLNGRAFINVFVDWIGYAMFIKDCKYEKFDKEKQKIYQEVWKKCIKPMYLEFYDQFKNK